jgi:hypothetical protein
MGRFGVDASADATIPTHSQRFKAPPNSRPVTYISSGFQTIPPKDKNAQIIKAKSEARALIIKYADEAAQHAVQLQLEPNDDMVVHSQQHQLQIQLDERGRLQEDRGNVVLFPNIIGNDRKIEVYAPDDETEDEDDRAGAMVMEGYSENPGIEFSVSLKLLRWKMKPSRARLISEGTSTTPVPSPPQPITPVNTFRELHPKSSRETSPAMIKTFEDPIRASSGAITAPKPHLNTGDSTLTIIRDGEIASQEGQKHTRDHVSARPKIKVRGRGEKKFVNPDEHTDQRHVEHFRIRGMAKAAHHSSAQDIVARITANQRASRKVHGNGNQKPRHLHNKVRREDSRANTNRVSESESNFYQSERREQDESRRKRHRQV